MLLYRLYLYTPNGYKKMGVCDYETIMFTLNNFKEYEPDSKLIVIEQDEDTNTDSIFFCDYAKNFGKGENYEEGKIKRIKI